MGVHEDMSNCIIIDNLPVIDASKYEKLHAVVQKVINKVEKVVPKTYELCREEDGKTAGFAFVEYESSAAAERAVQKLDKMRLDKQHVLKVCPFNDYMRYKNTPETFEEEADEEDTPKTELSAWLLDEGAREQFFTRCGDDTEVVWHDPSVMAKISSAYRNSGWTDLHARWSPLGTYMVTFHSQGVRIWGGPNFTNLGKFAHSNVQMHDFSPKERFLVTWYNNMTVWDVKSGKKLRQLPGGPAPDAPWPVLRWSATEEYMSRKSEDSLLIFDTETMKLIQPDENKQTTMFIPHIRDVQWSPTDNMFAYWVQEDGHKPTRVELIKVEKKKDGEVSFTTVARKTLFSVEDVRIHWHNSGDFLCVKVDRYSKTSTTKEKITNFELFRLRGKGEVAVDVVSFNEHVVAFAWEPKGVRFAVIHGRPGQGMHVSFYSMGPKGSTVKKLHSVDRKSASHLFWSPRGTHIIIADVSQPTGAMEFYNVNDAETMNTAEHYLCTDVAWDASGRYVATSVSAFRYQSDTGYIIWSFQGQQLLQVAREKFFQFEWRPRPASLLPENRVRTIAKNLRERSKDYERQQREMEQREQSALQRERSAKMVEFRKYLDEARKRTAKLRAERRGSRRCEWDSDTEDVFVEEVVTEEVIISVEEEEMPE